MELRHNLDAVGRFKLLWPCPFLPLPSPPPAPALNYMPVYPWQQVYKAAVLERDPAKLEEFVQSAFTVIYEHLRARGDITAEESEALLDALHALERLQKSKPGQSRRAA